MNLHNSDHPSSSSSSSSPSQLPNTPQFNLQQAITKLQNHCSSFFHHHHQQVFNPNLNSVKTNLESTILKLQNQAKHAIGSLSSPQIPAWARIATDNNVTRDTGTVTVTVVKTDIMKNKLGHVPVYAISNANEQLFMLSGGDSGKSLALLCFNEGDAKALLAHMKSVDPRMPSGAKAVPMSLSEILKLKADGVAFRMMPESSQIKNAIQARHKAGYSDNSFAGVPVFQATSLVLMMDNKKYRPVFFRMEDLEKSHAKAASQQRYLNPLLRQKDIQIAVLEDIIKGMKDNSTTDWNDVVFVPPGRELGAPAKPSRR